MTTLTHGQNEPLFIDLNSASAEVIQGGYALEAYDGAFLSGRRLAVANFALPTLKYNNQISSIEINEGTWRIYDLPNYQGSYRTLGKGIYNMSSVRWFTGSRFSTLTANNDVSSIRRIS